MFRKGVHYEKPKESKKGCYSCSRIGNSFSPGHKALAKEMLPIIDKPTIQYIVEEAKKSGIEDILVVTGKGKRPIEDHFDSVPELEQNLKEKGKTELLRLVQQTTDINLYFIRQSHPRGLGDAVLMAKDFVGDEPFVVMLGDDIMEDKVPLTKQLMDRYEETHASTLAVMKVPHEEVSSTVLLIQRQKLVRVCMTLSVSLKSRLLKRLRLILQSSVDIC